LSFDTVNTSAKLVQLSLALETDLTIYSHELIYLVPIFFSRPIRPWPFANERPLGSGSLPTCTMCIQSDPWMVDLRRWFNNWWAYSSPGRDSSPAVQNYYFIFWIVPGRFNTKINYSARFSYFLFAK
jgi:hypothetical protein